MITRCAWILLAAALLSSAILFGAAFSPMPSVTAVAVSEGFSASGRRGGRKTVAPVGLPERDLTWGGSSDLDDAAVAGHMASPQKSVPSFRRHADDFARELAGPSASASGKSKLTEVVDSAPVNFELQTRDYVARALAAPSMAGFRSSLARSPENLRRRMGPGPAADAAGSEGVQAYFDVYKSAVIDPRDVPSALVGKLGKASALARASLEAVLAKSGRGPSDGSGAAGRELAGLLSAPVWPWRIAVVGGCAKVAAEGASGVAAEGASGVAAEGASGVAAEVGAEVGLPHTVHDVIVVPQTAIGTKSLEELASLLIHEATHVFQRMRPLKSGEILKRDFSFVPARPGDAKGIPDDAAGSVRVNPDTDDLRWAKLVRGGETLLPVPVFVKGKGFRDVKLLYGAPGILQLPAEHPKEVMAYAWQKLARRSSI